MNKDAPTAAAGSPPFVAGGDCDPEIMLAVGREMLAGRPTPDDANEARALIAQAAARGQADALVMQATLIAADADTSGDFEMALDLLTLAATAGSPSAQGQLRALAGTDGASPRDWIHIRAGIDMAAWFSPPPRVVLRDTPRLRATPGFASKTVCDWLIERARPQMEPALVYDQRLGHSVARHESRSNSATVFDILTADVVMMAIRARIAAATRLPVSAMELPQVLHYKVGQQFTPHFDYLDTDKPSAAAEVAENGQRIATFLLYLNADYDGGATEFPELGLRHRGKAGDGLFFANVDTEHRPDPLTLHAGAAPTVGEKWVLSQWIRDRARPRMAGAFVASNATTPNTTAR